MILIHVVFQTGFCVFVLSNYMKTITKEITEAALVDGAPSGIYGASSCRCAGPALAALATLVFTFIYNDFFWALLLMKSGDKRPITSALNNLQGLLRQQQPARGRRRCSSCIPTILVFIALQKQFVRGLTLGSTKG